MPEEKGSLNIGNQTADRDIVNVAGNYIIQHPITHEPVYIPTIQSVLRKGETTNGDFFKKEPEWVDYEQGFIVERKEVDDIIRKLETNKIQLVLGAPASGKSIILKNVGFELANDGKKVYVVELKKHPQDEIKLFFENIPKIDEDNPIFIIDDAHLNISECEKLIRNFKGRGKGKLIIGSRETKEITIGYPTQASEFEYLSKTAIKINVEDVTEEMIKTFLKAKHHLSDERRNSISGNLYKFKKDLWHLSWALKSYKSEKDTLEEDMIYEMIKERIKKTDADDVFLPLSIFYRYEIPIEKKFLEKQLGIKKETIEQLIGLSEIMATEDKGKPVMLSLSHSSLAELYFGSYQNYPSLGEDIKESILNGKEETELEYCLFYRYLTTTDSRNAVDVVIYLRRNSWNTKTGATTLLKNLIEEGKIQESIEKGIVNEENIEKIGECVLDIEVVNKKVGVELANRIVGAISEKLKMEEDIGKIGKCLRDIVDVNKEAGLKLAKLFDFDVLSSKIEMEEDIEKIGMCVYGFESVSLDMGLKLAEGVDINVLSTKIDKEKDFRKIGLGIALITHPSKKVASNLVNLISIDSLLSKIEMEERIELIGNCISNINFIDDKVGLKLVNSIDIDALSMKIDKRSEREIIIFFSSFRTASEEVAQEIFNQVNPKLREKLQNKYYLGF